MIPLSFHGSEAIPLGSCPPREFQGLLKHIAVQAQYEAVAYKQRKDVCKPSGLVDVTLSTTFLRNPTFQTPHFPSATSHFELVLVRRTLTKDRLRASGWAADSLRRFRGKTKETLAHLIFQCSEYHSWTSRPLLREFGANFSLATKVEDTAVAPFHEYAPLQEFWTDGSLIWQIVSFGAGVLPNT